MFSVAFFNFFFSLVLDLLNSKFLTFYSKNFIDVSSWFGISRKQNHLFELGSNASDKSLPQSFVKVYVLNVLQLFPAFFYKEMWYVFSLHQIQLRRWYFVIFLSKEYLLCHKEASIQSDPKTQCLKNLWEASIVLISHANIAKIFSYNMVCNVNTINVFVLLKQYLHALCAWELHMEPTTYPPHYFW